MSLPDEFERDDAHQPPNQADGESLARAPLACQITRHRLRDYADGDLEASDRRLVEHHVHECRACAVELARVEYETLSLRQAMASSAAPAKPRPGFARRTLARVLSAEPEAALYAEGIREVELGNHVGAAPKRLIVRVLAKTAAELAAEPQRKRAQLVRSRVAASFAFVAALLVVLASPFWSGNSELEGSVRLALVRANLASVLREGSREQISAGEGLGLGDHLVLHADGSADAEWYDASVVGEQPAAQLRIVGDTDLQVDAQLELDHGSLEVLSHRPLDIALGDGSSLELGAGLYRIDAVPLPGADGGLDVRVEVERGEPAQIARATGSIAVVNLGQSGQFGRGGEGIAIENLNSFASGSLSLAGGARQSVSSPEAPIFTGLVLDAYGSPLAHATARLSFPTNAGVITRAVSTDHAGFYSTPADGLANAAIALVEVMPPAGRADLGFAPLDALRIAKDGSHLEIPDVVLRAGSVVRGSVVDPSDVPRPYAVAVPVLYDEALAQAWPWMEGTVFCDAQGQFEFRGLPARLASAQSFGALVYHPESEATFVPMTLSSSGLTVGARLRTRALASLRITHLPPSRASVVLEEVTGLPAGLAIRRHMVTADSMGIVESLRCGRGRLWLEAGTEPHPVLHPIARFPNGTAEVAGEQIERRLALWPMQPVPGVTANGLEMAVQHRFLEASATLSSGEELAVSTTSGSRIDDVLAFALRSRASGGVEARFLGFCQTGSSLKVRLRPDETEVLALHPASAMQARRDVLALRNGATHGRLQPMVLESIGRAALAEALQPNLDELSTTWTPLTAGAAGARPELFRALFRSESFVAEAIPPGDWQVRDSMQRTFRVRILPGQTATIR